MSTRDDYPRRGETAPAPQSRYPKHIRLNVRHQRWLAEIEQLNAARGMLPLPAHELIERALEAHARQLAQDNVESSVERMRGMSLPITVEKIPGEDAYKVFLNQNPIGEARPYDGEYTLAAYGRGPDSLGPILRNSEPINIRINELIDEGNVKPAEEPMAGPGGDQ